MENKKGCSISLNNILIIILIFTLIGVCNRLANLEQNPTPIPPLEQYYILQGDTTYY